MLKVYIPNKCINEQSYILEVMLKDFLGLDFEVEVYGHSDIKITKPDDDSFLLVGSDFFCVADKGWLKRESMPILPLQVWDISKEISANVVSEMIPVLYGRPGLIKKENYWNLKLDVFGSAFFMLTRYEELITKHRDCHERFPAWGSIAYIEGFLDRPIINEYLEILWFCFKSLWPNLQRKERAFRRLISCDVDHPFDNSGYSLKRSLFRVAARLFRDRSLRLAFLDGMNYLFKKFGSDKFDQYKKNIYWMALLNKKIGNKVSFFFIPIQTSKKYDNANDIHDEKMLNLIKDIYDSGHEIGFHPGYMTYKFADNFRKSAEAIKKSCAMKKVNQVCMGGRQHYLRYDISKTPLLWEENGFCYESSLGYADRAGFRAGICFEYPMYDLLGRRRLSLMQRPLIAMECTIISKPYENLGLTKEAFNRFTYFSDTCRKYEGDFTLLWHNSFFNGKKSKKFYEELIIK